MGYFVEEALTRKAPDGDGWLRTEDVGRMKKEDFLTLTGGKESKANAIHV